LRCSQAIPLFPQEHMMQGERDAKLSRQASWHGRSLPSIVGAVLRWQHHPEN